MSHASSSKDLDEFVIVATAIIILIAGYDTTGSTLAFVCYQLSKNPDVQSKLREEVQEVMQDRENITYDDLAKMTYMDQVSYIDYPTQEFHSSPLGGIDKDKQNSSALLVGVCLNLGQLMAINGTKGGLGVIH